MAGGGGGVWHVLGRTEVQIRFWWINLKEVNKLDDLGVTEGNVIEVIALSNPAQDSDKW